MSQRKNNSNKTKEKENSPPSPRLGETKSESGTPEKSENHSKNHEKDSTNHDGNVTRGRRESFVERPSLMDSHSQSEFAQNYYRGWFNFFAITLTVYAIFSQFTNLLGEGNLIGIEAIKRMFVRYDMWPTWLSLVLASFLSPTMEKLVVKQILPYQVVKILHIALQLMLLIGGTVVAVIAKWPLVPTLFYLAEVLIISMKVHSYFYTNRELQLAFQNKEEEIVKRSKTQWPENVTYANFLDFLLIPTLVYEIEYPRTNEIRINYVGEKCLSFVGIWTILHVVMTHYVTPVLEELPNLNPFVAFCSLSIPCLLCCTLMFYIIFDVCCNGFAELTYFADREFYQDWWNSTTLDEFARKWNRPVHLWLLRHVYLEGIASYKLNKKNATLVTFLFSSIIHEWFMSVSLRMSRPWLFILQMGQIPLITVSRFFHLEGTRMGNILFWIQLLIGVPLLTILYCREYYSSIQ
eukprot:TRINITY_DN5308_c0_g1_i1.p1 TRINITY_DN5308_c0_g1~~TRINITY_DN5308_c0_g1_i1.p1  ORF type:complete len:464 (-),score=155.93 TRINITY_DN5308_c0_g1_i1:45-1436(-)